MAQPTSRSELIDYCKRKLGAPVLEINVADEQIEDLVDDAIQFFHIQKTVIIFRFPLLLLGSQRFFTLMALTL